MSHFSCLRSKMTDVNLIEKACQSLGLTTVRSSYIRGWRNQCTPAELVIRMENGYDLGFEPTGDGTYHALADFGYAHAGENHGGDLQSLWQSIIGRYATSEALSFAQRNLTGANVNVKVSR